MNFIQLVLNEPIPVKQTIKFAAIGQTTNGHRLAPAKLATVLALKILKIVG